MIETQTTTYRKQLDHIANSGFAGIIVDGMVFTLFDLETDFSGNLDEEVEEPVYGYRGWDVAWGEWTYRGWHDPMTAENLDELLECLQDYDAEHSGVDLTSLPVFGGGEPPSGTYGIWSWDKSRVLVGSGDDLRIDTRKEWEERYK